MRLRHFEVKASFLWLLASLSMLAACASEVGSARQPVLDHHGAVFYPSANQNQRIRFVILHYTAGNWQQSLQALTEPTTRPVSSHYLIPQSQDASYPVGEPLKIYQLVAEQDRAWHAGTSRWQDRQNLNDQSIGIELVNEARCDIMPGEHSSVPALALPLCITPDFDPAQLLLLADLLQDILNRYPEITPDRVLAHSDIAPEQKQDPGPRFPWQWLASRGIGAWYDNQQLSHFWQQPLWQAKDVSAWQQALQQYGYAIAVTGELDAQSHSYLLAFQRHFVPEQMDAQPNRKTLAVLAALLAKYRPAALQHQPAAVQTAEIKP